MAHEMSDDAAAKKELDMKNGRAVDADDVEEMAEETRDADADDLEELDDADD